MDVGEGSSKTLPEQPVRTIQAGDTVLLKIPSGDVRTLKLEKGGTFNLGKFGSFHAADLIGQPYGLTYDISEKKLKVLPPRTFQEVEETDATNELINDSQIQPMTVHEIEELKKAGIPAEEIIKRQIEQHSSFKLKTEFSKEKYRKRKEAKYSKSFTTIIPTLYNVCDYWFKKDQNRIRDIRPDTLSQMLSMANVRPGGKYLAVDDASGIAVAGILERLGGQGRLITICDVESPPAYPVLTQMNFSKEVTSVMSFLNWATADEEYTPMLTVMDANTGGVKSESQRSRLNKRKSMADALSQTREELFAGEFDGLIVASQYEPFSILEKLSPYLAGSASIVVHSPQVQILSDLQAKLKDTPRYLAPAISEAWLRQYQILPGRTHPLMNASGSGGFILHTVKVYDDPTASSVMSHRQKRARSEKSQTCPSSAAPELEKMNTESQSIALIQPIAQVKEEARDVKMEVDQSNASS